ncbi:unnamed protein product [Prorocentrum cordatum]|uniref:Uncharacterized protein n=1 Tax=Prorocentrum cordatum TaxID=2364126 RepID=A0ABN9PY74_9DINO|nr:unnamed protein product [Polarella glacialis]
MPPPPPRLFFSAGGLSAPEQPFPPLDGAGVRCAAPASRGRLPAAKRPAAHLHGVPPRTPAPRAPTARRRRKEVEGRRGAQRRAEAGGAPSSARRDSDPPVFLGMVFRCTSGGGLAGATKQESDKNLTANSRLQRAPAGLARASDGAAARAASAALKSGRVSAEHAGASRQIGRGLGAWEEEDEEQEGEAAREARPFPARARGRSEPVQSAARPGFKQARGPPPRIAHLGAGARRPGASAAAARPRLCRGPPPPGRALRRARPRGRRGPRPRRAAAASGRGRAVHGAAPRREGRARAVAGPHGAPPRGGALWGGPPGGAQRPPWVGPLSRLVRSRSRRSAPPALEQRGRAVASPPLRPAGLRGGAGGGFGSALRARSKSARHARPRPIACGRRRAGPKPRR